MIEYAQQVPLIAEWFYNEWRTLYGEQTQTDVQRNIESWLAQGKGRIKPGTPSGNMVTIEGIAIAQALAEARARQKKATALLR